MSYRLPSHFLTLFILLSLPFSLSILLTPLCCQPEGKCNQLINRECMCRLPKVINSPIYNICEYGVAVQCSGIMLKAYLILSHLNRAVFFKKRNIYPSMGKQTVGQGLLFQCFSSDMNESDDPSGRIIYFSLALTVKNKKVSGREVAVLKLLRQAIIAHFKNSL